MMATDERIFKPLLEIWKFDNWSMFWGFQLLALLITIGVRTWRYHETSNWSRYLIESMLINVTFIAVTLIVIPYFIIGDAYFKLIRGVYAVSQGEAPSA